ncbi:protein of unknown function DUF885 [Candidatus Koribacter versatilis Ellin345]|uniref:DUF885 domain-containing protein n=1 Tax=Koribacter versatilis (strain Ellin345) TaxID=204669 RepID=Q1IV33_KORVE|nr:protein of unknown function DUF885 [Candidatus Koribacter versatilis Ellin345]
MKKPMSPQLQPAFPACFTRRLSVGGPLRRFALLLSLVFTLASIAFAQSPEKAPAPPAWIAESNRYANMLIEISFKHSPEFGSGQGLAEFDTKVAQPTLADENAERQETEAVVAKLEAAEKSEKDPKVKEDLEIMIRRMQLRFRDQDYARAREVPFYNASQRVFSGVRLLLDDQTPDDRRPAAVTRVREYAGLEAGYTPLTEILKKRTEEQMAKAGVIYPAKTEIETEMSRNANYTEGMAALLKKHKLTGWEEPLAKLKQQLTDYDAWVRANVLPKARSDFREAPERYALDLEGYGIDIPPAQLTKMAHDSFVEIQGEMKSVAAQIAKQRNLPSSDYRDVIHELKKQQIVGDAILPFYENRLKQIEQIIVDQQIVSLPSRPAKIRIATAAETAQQPAPHMVPPPFIHNTGQRGEFVLPLNIPAGPGQPASEKYDDFTFDAAAWTLTAHEARPGHELQFDSMLEHGVSLARARYAFNSTNAEGWGLYSEYLIKPYMPLEGQLISLQLRLQRAARAFLDPELQSGKVTPEDAYRVLEHDVCLSHAFAQEEVERFTYRAPGQANSYFYGYTRLLSLREETEKALAAKGVKFDQKKFHDFILAQGLLPPDLMRKAVLEEFVPAQAK